jgi:hypothetical protein
MSTGEVDRRLVVELKSLYVACNNCGHTHTFRPKGLLGVSAVGIHEYSQLCSKVKCSACPPTPPELRNVTLMPTWRHTSGTSSKGQVRASRGRRLYGR